MMKKIFILLAIVIGITSCEEPKDGCGIIIVKYTHEEYANYVMGIECGDSVKTDQIDISTNGVPIKPIPLCDGWWYLNTIVDIVGFRYYTSLGEMTWDEYNNLPEEEKSPAVSKLKDALPFADITEIALDDIITPNCDSYYDVYYLMDYSPVIVQIREIITSGQLKKYRRDSP